MWSCHSDSCSEQLFKCGCKGHRALDACPPDQSKVALKLKVGPGSLLIASLGMVGKCPEPTVMGCILRAPCSNRGSVPDMLCDPERINYLLCAFISSIVNRHALLDLCPCWEVCIKKTLKRQKQNHTAQRHCWRYK